MLATFFLGPQPFGPPKMSLVLRPPVVWSLILRTGAGHAQGEQEEGEGEAPTLRQGKISSSHFESANG